jgi:hypothetical protein
MGVRTWRELGNAVLIMSLLNDGLSPADRLHLACGLLGTTVSCDMQSGKLMNVNKTLLCRIQVV